MKFKAVKLINNLHIGIGLQSWDPDSTVDTNIASTKNDKCWMAYA